MKLEQAAVRLCERDRVLFEACVREIKINRQAKAAICANELSEVRKLHTMVSQCALALERIILRLETIKEVSEIMADLKPALRGLHAITENLVNVMPDVAQELGQINESISDTLAMTRFTSSPEELKRVSFTIERQPSLEDVILDYAKQKGEIDVDQCANELSVPHVEVEQALENLGKKRRIVIQR